MSKIFIDCLEIEQPIGKFYVGVMDASDLLAISYADVRRIADRDVELYLGIQRPLSTKRVKEIKDYVNTIDSTFPTGVILAIDSDFAKYDEEMKKLEIEKQEDVAKIIDGQHRIAGLEDFSKSKFQMNVVIFIDMDIEDQAMVFATINLAQTRVSKSLVYDLYEYTHHRSPTKTCHNIARLLNSREDSPFFNRIKILGTATEKNQPLSQATFVESMLKFISGTQSNALSDRDKMKKGENLKRASRDEQKLVFRNFFIDKKDAEIAKNIFNYFNAIKKTWANAWDSLDQQGNILPKTNGFRAFMRIFPTIYISLDKQNGIISESSFLEVFKSFSLKNEDFNIDNYKPGTSGESELAKELSIEFRRFLLDKE